MARPFLIALAPAIALACNVFCQIAWLRVLRQASLLRSICAGFLAGVAAVLGLHAGLGWDGAAASDFYANLLANLIAYGFLSYCYFNFLNLGETGRRVRLMRELYESADGLTVDQILSRYNAKDMVSVRLSRLINNGQVVLENGRYRSDSRTLAMVAGVIVLMKKAVLGRSSEFDF